MLIQFIMQSVCNYNYWWIAVMCTSLTGSIYVYAAIGINDTVYIKHASTSLTKWYYRTFAGSRIHCCVLCGYDTSCHSVSYRRTDRDCRLSSLWNGDVDSESVSDPNTDTFALKDTVKGPCDLSTEWLLMFRGTPGINIDPYLAYTQGMGVTTYDPLCMTFEANACALHYRNTCVDSWNSMEITEVRYSYYKNGAEVAYVTFDGTASSYTGWFESARMVDSSWANILTEPSFDKFKMGGNLRRFAMNTNTGILCGNLWSYGATVTFHAGCAIDTHFYYPQFLYSKGASASKATRSSDFAPADSIAIHVRKV